MDNELVNKIWESYKTTCKKCPPKIEILNFFEDTISLLFPPYNNNRFKSYDEVEKAYTRLKSNLHALLITTNPKNYEQISTAFFKDLVDIKVKLELDAKFIYEHDPASVDIEEVIRTYPGFLGISAYRVAHSLHKVGVKIIPRVITEYANTKTGIDIHPNAKVGYPFFIDHGTAIVVGATCVIGDRVKLYQNVTLGALSVDKKDSYNKKRHPTIENDVIIFSGATILGGDTVIGECSVIGGNVWLIKSVPKKSKIYYSPPQQREFNANT